MINGKINRFFKSLQKPKEFDANVMVRKYYTRKLFM